MAVSTRPMIYLEEGVKTRSQSESVFELRVPSFTVGPGELVAIIGESGCGKSTLLDLVALVMEPTRVRRFEIVTQPKAPPVDIAALWTQGNESALAALRRDNFGYVLQTGGLLPFLSVRQNILLPASLTNTPLSRQHVDALAQDMGVGGCLDRMPASLSIGQRQRVAILRALAHGPRLVLADEPTAAVDKGRARAIMDDMHRLAREHCVAVVIVTHDVDLVLDRADAVYTFDLEHISDNVTHSLCRPYIEGAA